MFYVYCFITSMVLVRDTFVAGRQEFIIIRQIGHWMGGNFNIHILAWSASPSVEVGRL